MQPEVGGKGAWGKSAIPIGRALDRVREVIAEQRDLSRLERVVGEAHPGFLEGMVAASSGGPQNPHVFGTA